MLKIVGSVFWLALAGTAAAAQISGPARVIDGDTLEVGSQRVRLWGVDAAEGRQRCLDSKRRPYDCGRVAAAALTRRVAQGPVSCRQMDRDRYQRAVARCTVAGQDLAAWLVGEGHALDYRAYSGGAYSQAEARARSKKAGMWAGEFELPWTWRAADRGAPAAPRSPGTHQRPPGACTIKGNINGKGERIYHLPGMSSYAATRINPAAGERWFCSAADARSAGWRAPR